MIQPEDITSLSNFQRNAKKHIARLRKTRRPEVLTVNGEAAAVLLHPAAFGELMNRAYERSELEKIRWGLAEMDAGLGRPLDDVVRDIRATRKAYEARRKSA